MSLFDTELTTIELPGYRWVAFRTHRARKPVPASSAHQQLHAFLMDPAYVDEYWNFADEHEVAHGPFLLARISGEDYLERSPALGLKEVCDAVLEGRGVYRGCAPPPGVEAVDEVHANLRRIPEDCAYFQLQLDLERDRDRMSEAGWIFCEYEEHLFLSADGSEIHSVTVGCD